MLGPVAQTRLIGIVGIELKCSMTMDVHESGNNALGSVIVIRVLAAVRQNGSDLAVLNINTGRNKLVCDPDFLTLNNHFIFLLK